MVHRLVKLPEFQSFFLFGARGTGKSTLLSAQLPQHETAVFDLLIPELQESFLHEPSRLERLVLALPEQKKNIVIDEVQKLPKLLDVVHRLIETKGMERRFILTGSSARKLKAGRANMLGGRALWCALYPLLEMELQDRYPLDEALRWGTLPKVVTAAQADRDGLLRAYAQVYLKEEIAAEQLVRNLDPFRKFLPVAAQSSGKILNFSRISRDVGVDTKTVQSYFSILEDTLVGYFREPWHASVRKRLRQSPKFYFFDTGVVRALSGQLRVPPTPGTGVYGELFEHHVIRELVHSASTLQMDFKFGYLMTERDVEIDLVIQRPGQAIALVEIKSKDQVREEDTRNLKAFKAGFPDAELYVLSRDPQRQRFPSGALAVHWKEGGHEILGI